MSSSAIEEATRVVRTDATEGARRATGVASGEDAIGEVVDGVPNPEVPAKAKRRQFAASYKLRILKKADACKSPSEVGALLRREGLYSSHLTTWRQHREAGTLRALSSKKRGRKGKSPLEQENEKLRRENVRLQRKLKRAEFILDIQKKASEILGIELPPVEEDEND